MIKKYISLKMVQNYTINIILKYTFCPEKEMFLLGIFFFQGKLATHPAKAELTSLSSTVKPSLIIGSTMKDFILLWTS